jgi:hypothetical protein
MNCTRCGKEIEGREGDPAGSGDDVLAPLVEVGTCATGRAGPEQLCASCREEAKLFGAAALFGLGELLD